MNLTSCVECGSPSPGDPAPNAGPWTLCGACGRASGIDPELGVLTWWIEQNRFGMWSIWENHVAKDTVRFLAVEPFQTRHEALLYLEKRLAAHAPPLIEPGSNV